jgi:dephospho-CoA kinase
MFRVGLTGNIASGKSTVARVWARLGAAIIDADVLARRAVEPGMPAFRRIVETFGPDVLAADGRLDRAALRRIVFRDPAARARLEAIVHPEVARLREEEEAALAARGAEIVVHDVPLLFEVGLEDAFDVVVLVDAPEAIRLERLVRDRGLDEAEARHMIDAQMPAAEKRGRADYIIDNDGTLQDLESRATETWRKIVERARGSA